MRYLFIIILLSFKLRILSQKSFTSDNRNTVKTSCGLFIPLKSQFRNPLSSTFNSSVDNPISFISIGHEHPRGFGRKNNFAESGIGYFFNQNKLNSDSSETSWFATSFFLVFKFDIFPQNKHIDLCFGVGPSIGFQCINIRKESSQFYRNFFASVIPHFDFRVQPSKRISTGFNSYFLFDITNSKWKTFDTKTNTIDYSKFSGFSCSIFIGYCFGK